jgi:hypothetical protein
LEVDDANRLDKQLGRYSGRKRGLKF